MVVKIRKYEDILEKLWFGTKFDAWIKKKCC
jgi:hypothetical protein